MDPGVGWATWRNQARRLLAENIPPEEIIWEAEQGLFSRNDIAEEPVAVSTISVPKDFIDLAKLAACHSEPTRWSLLYRILWRIVKGGEKHLCSLTSDPDVSKATTLRKNVSREIHKMHAFVRFKDIGIEMATGRERFVAWFEPDYWIVEAGTPFFQKRFANMDWSIFTPKGCAHWDGAQLCFSPGIGSDPTGDPDAMEAAWKTYYRNIFNPARLKVKAMQTEMPKKYWKNLPEAELIEELIQGSSNRVQGMFTETLRPAKGTPKNQYLDRLREMTAVSPCFGPLEGQNLAEMAEAARGCRACPLWEHATGTVFGEGSADARMMIIGEQPGDREDVAGRPFVGPAGKLLDQALLKAGIQRENAYLTNAVKHFKWTPHETSRGKMRLHQSPTKGEIDLCRPWVLGELQRISPDVIILLGATAARSLLGKTISVTKNRGVVEAPQLAKKVILTVHPSFLLRLSDRAGRQAEYERFIADLKLAVE